LQEWVDQATAKWGDGPAPFVFGYHADQETQLGEPAGRLLGPFTMPIYESVFETHRTNFLPALLNEAKPFLDSAASFPYTSILSNP
jgi:hypothetical protein